LRHFFDIPEAPSYPLPGEPDGATQLCVFEPWCESGHGAPTDLHDIGLEHQK
jgi:hypothetical protein